MRAFALSSLLTLALTANTAGVVLAQSAMPAPDASTIGTVQTMTVSAKDMATLKTTTNKYLDSALHDQDAFYAALTKDYTGINTNGKVYTAGQVYGAIQALKQPLSGMVTRVHVIDAHHLGDTYDETATIGGTADTIDSASAHPVSATWVHKITFKKDASGNFLVQRDQVLSRIANP